MLLSFGDSEPRLDLTFPACSPNHLNINTIPKYSIFTHCSIQAVSRPTEETPPLVWEGGACVLNANRQLGVSLPATVMPLELWLTEQGPFVRTLPDLQHRGSFQSSQDLGICSNCFTNCCPLNLGWLLKHQEGRCHKICILQALLEACVWVWVSFLFYKKGLAPTLSDLAVVVKWK